MGPDTVLTWTPPWWRVLGYAAGAVAAVAAAFATDDASASLMLGIVALGAVVLAVRDALARPALRADRHGLAVVDGFTRRRLSWPEVTSVRARTVNRRGLVHLRTLELETADGLVIASRRQLGADPEQVAEDLEELRLRSATWRS